VAATKAPKPIQHSMVAHIVSSGKGYTYYWYASDRGTVWAKTRDQRTTRVWNKVDQIVRVLYTEGFGRYSFQGKVIPLKPAV